MNGVVEYLFLIHQMLANTTPGYSWSLHMMSSENDKSSTVRAIGEALPSDLQFPNAKRESGHQEILRPAQTC